MEYCKRIVVLAKTGESFGSCAKGYLSLEQTGEDLHCVFKSFSLETNEDLHLGIEIDEVPLRAIYIKRENKCCFEFSLNNALNIAGKVNAVVLTAQGFKPVLFGSTYGESIHDLNALLARLKKFNGLAVEVAAAHSQHAEKKAEATSFFAPEDLFIDDENLAQLIEEEIAKEEGYEISDKAVGENAQEEYAEPVCTASPPLFYHLIKEQIEDMFATFPRDSKLEALIENSRWVHIDYSNGLYYGLGLLYEGASVKYICYAVPSDKGFVPPDDIKEFCQWLPVDGAVGEHGYYMMYQNAENGENIFVN